MRESGVLTSLLNAAQSGDAAAAQSAYDLVYAELKRRARNSLRGAAPDQTLTPTALVHEVYVRFSEREAPPLRDRTHFYALAARAMRQILVDHARRHRSQKRGGGAPPVPLSEVLAFAPVRSDDVLALDDALTALAAVDERKCRVVELRYFAGLSVEETARALGVSVGTIGREQRLAEAWLHRELSREPS